MVIMIFQFKVYLSDVYEIINVSLIFNIGVVLILIKGRVIQVEICDKCFFGFKMVVK